MKPPGRQRAVPAARPENVAIPEWYSREGVGWDLEILGQDLRRGVRDKIGHQQGIELRCPSFISAAPARMAAMTLDRVSGPIGSCAGTRWWRSARSGVPSVAIKPRRGVARRRREQ